LSSPCWLVLRHSCFFPFDVSNHFDLKIVHRFEMWAKGGFGGFF
jgi:hypothetical protein